MSAIDNFITNLIGIKPATAGVLSELEDVITDALGHPDNYVAREQNCGNLYRIS